MADDLQPQSRINRGQWLVLVAAVLGWMFDGVEIGLAPIMGRPALLELPGRRAPIATSAVGSACFVRCSCSCCCRRRDFRAGSATVTVGCAR